MGCKKSELTDKLELEGKLDYGPGAYDRIGTFAPTKSCLNCGCKWHNTADLRYWSKIAEEKEPTKEDYGIFY